MSDKIKISDKKAVTNAVSKIVDAHFNTETVSAKYLGGGSFGKAYKFVLKGKDAPIVVKAYNVDGLHEKEAFQLRLLAAYTGIKYPKVYFTYNKTEELPFDCLCMEFIEGKNAFADLRLLLKSKKAKRRFAETVVNSMLEIHSHTNVKFGPVEDPAFDSWLHFYKPYASEIFEKAEGLSRNNKLSRSIVAVMEHAWRSFDRIFYEEVTAACLIHGDLNVMNIMVKRPFEVTGIIDPLNSMYADREYDLFQLNNLTGKFFGLYNCYKEKYKVSRNCDIKCAFYAMWHEAYCFIKTGRMHKVIMYPIVWNLKKHLKENNLYKK